MTTETTAAPSAETVLAIIRDAHEATTPGPWRVVINDAEDAILLARACTSDQHSFEQDPGGEYVQDCCADTLLLGEEGFHSEADADFVAAAHEGVPRLLKAVEAALESGDARVREAVTEALGSGE